MTLWTLAVILAMLRTLVVTLRTLLVTFRTLLVAFRTVAVIHLQLHSQRQNPGHLVTTFRAPAVTLETLAATFIDIGYFQP